MADERETELLAAAELYRPLRRGARSARRSGKWLVVFGVLSGLLGAVNADAVGIVLGAVIGVLGHRTQRLGGQLAAADAEAPRGLARLQVAVGAALILHSLLMLTLLRPDHDGLYSTLENAQGIDLDVRGLTESLHDLVHGTVILVAFVYHAWIARYFLRFEPRVADYLENAKAWARETVESMEG